MTASLLRSAVQNHLTTHLPLLQFSRTNLLSVPTVVALFLRVYVILFTGRLSSPPVLSAPLTTTTSFQYPAQRSTFPDAYGATAMSHSQDVRHVVF